ncbi:MAG: hypothetical protein FWC73_12100 [Defluviitaleaceae bacterium]|nr:hypothetical protein [Defluviitaleaceae bacterium]
MNNFLWIFRHYLKKNFLTPANLLVIGLPIIFMLTFHLLNNYLLELLGTEVVLLYGIGVPMVLGFQFFGADLTADWLHHDMKGPTRARLLVSPVAPRVFYAGVMLAGWLFNVFYGSIVVAITAAAFGETFGNYGLVLLVLLCLSFITQLVGVLIFYFTKDEKSGTRLSYVFGEIMIGITILPFVFPDLFDTNGPAATLINHFPTNVGLNIIYNNNLLYNLAVMLGIVALLSLVAFIIGRQRNDNL